MFRFRRRCRPYGVRNFYRIVSYKYVAPNGAAGGRSRWRWQFQVALYFGIAQRLRG